MAIVGNLQERPGHLLPPPVFGTGPRRPGSGQAPLVSESAVRQRLPLEFPLTIGDGCPSMLALRNLERGNIFKLPSGQEVATALGEEPIPDEDLVIGKATEKGEKTPLAQIAEGFAGRAPCGPTSCPRHR